MIPTIAESDLAKTGAAGPLATALSMIYSLPCGIHQLFLQMPVLSEYFFPKFVKSANVACYISALVIEIAEKTYGTSTNKNLTYKI